MHEKRNRTDPEEECKTRVKIYQVNLDRDQAHAAFRSLEEAQKSTGQAGVDASLYRRHKTTLNPIIDWTDAEVWTFIRRERIPYCCLYDEGFHRLGCIGCPMASRRGRSAEFARWPKYKAAYLHAFEKMIAERERRGKIDGTWRIGTDPMEIFHWWMEDGVLPGQLVMDEFDE